MKYFLKEDRFLPEMHLKQSRFIYDNFFWQFLKRKEEFKNLYKQEIQIIFIRNDLDKDCFQHDMAYGKYKYLTKRTESDKVLRDKANNPFKIASNPKYNFLIKICRWWY